MASINIKVDTFGEVCAIMNSVDKGLGELKSAMSGLSTAMEQYDQKKYDELRKKFNYANNDLNKVSDSVGKVSKYTMDVYNTFYQILLVYNQVLGVAEGIKVPRLPSFNNLDRAGFHASVSAFSANASKGDARTGGYGDASFSFLNAHAYAHAGVDDYIGTASASFGAGFSVAEGSVQAGYKDNLLASASFEFLSAQINASGEAGWMSYDENGNRVIDPRFEVELAASATVFKGETELYAGGKYAGIKAEGNVSAYSAEAEFKASASKDKLAASLDVSAVAYKAEGGITASVFDFPLGVEYGVEVGFAFSVDIEIGLLSREWSIGGEFALLLGVSFDLTIPNPLMLKYELAMGAINLCVDVVSAAVNVVKDIGNAIADAFSGW